MQRNQVGQVFSFANDPLEINLPTYGGADSTLINRESLEVLAALYFQAELEQAGIIPIAELLTENRFSLQLRDTEAADMFEQFSSRLRGEWYTRQMREQIFARTFGLGAQASNEAGSMVNRNFETLFAQSCYALGRYQSLVQTNVMPGVHEVQVEAAFNQLLQNLGGKLFGNSLLASSKIQQQLQMAINLLNHRGVTSLFQARNIWQLIGNVLGADTPDYQRIVTRAQSGLRIIGWLAANLTAIRGEGLQNALFNQTGIFVWAASWLQASGIGQAITQSTNGGYRNPMYRQANNEFH